MIKSVITILLILMIGMTAGFILSSDLLEAGQNISFINQTYTKCCPEGKPCSNMIYHPDNNTCTEIICDHMVENNNCTKPNKMKIEE